MIALTKRVPSIKINLMHKIGGFCLKDDCPNETNHKSGHCKVCRTFNCLACGKNHTITIYPPTPKDKLCAHCRRYPKRVREILEKEKEKSKS